MTKRIYRLPRYVDGNERELLVGSIDSNWITTLGPQIDAFEQEMCDNVGARHAVALATGTAAFHRALVSLAVKPGDEVIWCCSNWGQ